MNCRATTMKLEVEINVTEGTIDKHELEERLRKEAILALFADRKIPAGQAARDLGMGRLEFMELLKQRGVPHIIYTIDDWDADGKAIEEFERRRGHG
jgi:predicted HTH domain antitoxin